MDKDLLKVYKEDTRTTVSSLFTLNKFLFAGPANNSKSTVKKETEKVVNFVQN